MSGRPYSISELKGIVDYIVERRLYSEYKGRKMWQDYAGSSMTTRTWQSLKEAFIKRVLPDIHNPVYRLNLDQIRSFRCGYDIKTRENEGKLEFRSASSIQKPSKHVSKSHGDDTPGEPHTSQIVIKRESTDTIVLGTDKCVEIIDSDDEQPTKEKSDRDSSSPDKRSIRDFITYSEPLTPMLQEILHDFDSEDEEPEVKTIFETQLEIIDHGIDVEPDEAETQILIEETNKEPVQEENSSKENINTENNEEHKKNKKKSSSKKASKKSAKKVTRKAVSENEIDTNTQNSSEVFEKNKFKKSSKKTALKTSKKTLSDGEGPSTTDIIRITRSNQLTPTAEKDNKVSEETPEPTATNNTEIDKGATQNLTSSSMVATAGTNRESIPDSLLPNNQEGLSEETNKRQTRSSTDQDISKTQTPTEPSQIIETKAKQKATSEDNENNKVNPQDKLNDTEGWSSHKYNDKDYEPSKENQKGNNDVDKQTSKDDTAKPTIGSEDSKNQTSKDDTAKPTKGKENTQNKESETKSNKAVDPPKSLTVDSSQQRKKSPRTDKKEHTNSKQGSEVKKTSWLIRENQTEGLKLILEKKLGSSQSILESQYSESDVDTPLLNQNQKESSSSLSEKEDTTKSNTKTRPDTSKSQNEARTITTDAEIHTDGTSKAGPSKAIKNQPSTSKSTNIQLLGTVENPSKPITILDPEIRELSDTPTDASDRPQKRKMAALVNGLFSNRRDGVNRKRFRGRRQDRDGSSSWTSDSDDDIFDTLPGRRRRHSRYANSKKILIDEDGNAFFVVGRKLEALKKHTVVDNSSQDFWKQKFLEEQNRNADLIKLLSRISETNKFEREHSPVLQPKPSPPKPIEAPPVNEPTMTNNVPVQNGEKAQPHTVCIQFVKDNQVNIQGDWETLQPILPEVLSMLKKTEHKEEINQPDTNGDKTETKDNQSNSKQDKTPTKNTQSGTKVDLTKAKGIQSGSKRAQRKSKDKSEIKGNQRKSKDNESEIKENGVEVIHAENRGSKVDSDLESAITIRDASDDEETARVHEKINKLEEEILKDILQKEGSPSLRYSTDSIVSIASSVNVNPRSKRVRKKLSPDVLQLTAVVEEPPPKRIRGNKSDGDVNVSRRKKKVEAKVDGVASDSAVANTVKRQAANKKSPVTASRRSSTRSITASRRSSTKSMNAPLDVIEENESDEIRYRFPSPIQENKKNTPNTRQKKQKAAEKTTELQVSHIPEQSMESSQGYLDTDCSSFTVINLRRKKKLTLATKPHRAQQGRNFRRVSRSTYAEDTSESSNSCFNIPAIKINGRKSRSLFANTSRNKIDSYQLIMAQRKEIQRLSIERSNAIDQNRGLNFSPASQNLEGSIVSQNINSSSISLPASPEISMVGNISIESSCLRRVFEHPSLNESHEVDPSNDMDTAFMSRVDASLPLMSQDCNFTINRETNNNISDSAASTMKDLQASETSEPTNNTDIQNNLANTEETVNESLHIKLSNMLLESAKKMSRKVGNDKENNLPIVKEKNKKRCSTPRKRRVPKKLLTQIDAIMEEHTENCSSGRKSAPPKLCTEICIQENSITLPDTSFNEKPKRSRKSKEVLKVKIGRPKRSRSRLSIMTDSGINDNSTLYDDNASVDLIHNHSETCVENECMSDSCEIIDKTVSIVTITSNSNISDNQGSDNQANENQASSPIFFSAYSSDGSMKHDALLSKSTMPTLSPRFHSVVSPSSLITDDLSDEETTMSITNVRPDWYLYSETDTNTNLTLLKPQECTMGASLNQIFPIVCAVPDLSTITEHTEANDENSKRDFGSTANSDSTVY